MVPNSHVCVVIICNCSALKVVACVSRVLGDLKFFFTICLCGYTDYSVSGMGILPYIKLYDGSFEMETVWLGTICIETRYESSYQVSRNLSVRYACTALCSTTSCTWPFGWVAGVLTSRL